MALRDPQNRPSRSVLTLLVLACLALMLLDVKGGNHSPVEPLRVVAGDVVGPVESGASAVVRPFADLGGFVHSNRDLRGRVARLEAENSRLRGDLDVKPYDQARLRELDGLSTTAAKTGYALVPARVIAMGPMQSFSRTVTIDAGTSSGVRADMTVLNNDGLVGRVVRATRSTATVLLIVDPDSVVGGRLGANLEIGFLKGRGSIGGHAALDLDLLDNGATPAKGDVVVSWGSNKGVPYVAGIPIGKVESVYSTPRESSSHAVIRPFVDFSALDVVGVVVPRTTKGDRALITGGGSQ